MENYTTLIKKIINFQFKLNALKEMNPAFDSDSSTFQMNDKMVAYEVCDKECDSLGKGPNFKPMLANLLDARSKLVSPSVGSGKLGDTKTNPANSCSLIMQMYPEAKSGF